MNVSSFFFSTHPQNHPHFCSSSPLCSFLSPISFSVTLLSFPLSDRVVGSTFGSFMPLPLVDTTVLILTQLSNKYRNLQSINCNLCCSPLLFSSPFCFPLSLTILYSGLYCLLLSASFSLPRFFFPHLCACPLLSIFNCFQLGPDKLWLTVASILSIIKTLTFIHQNLKRVSCFNLDFYSVL